MCLGPMCCCVLAVYRHTSAAGTLSGGGGGRHLGECAQLQLLQAAARINSVLQSPVAAAVGSCCSCNLFTTHIGAGGGYTVAVDGSVQQWRLGSCRTRQQSIHIILLAEQKCSGPLHYGAIGASAWTPAVSRAADG